MDLKEELIYKKYINNSTEDMNPKVQYSDEFYDWCVSHCFINTKMKLFYKFIKRTFDIIVSFVALLILFIPMLIIAVAIKCDSKGPVIFKNRRVGKDATIFYCLKFRSMSVETPPEVATSVFTGEKSYITKVGAFLRKTSLDEIPQLINVLLGQMSIIGYRPLVPTEINCNNMREKLGVFRMRPGISGYSQVHGRDDVYYKNKALMDAYYCNNASIKMDISIMCKTIQTVFNRKGNWA